ADLVQVAEEDSVALEELAAVGARDGAEHVRARGKFGHQRIGRVVGGLGRGGVDDGDDAIDPLWEGAVEHRLLLPPRQRARHQLVAVAGDDEMPDEIIAAQDCGDEEAEYDRPYMARREPHHARDRGRRKVAAPRRLWGSGERARLKVYSVMHSE